MKIGIDIDNVISNFDEELLKVFKEHDKSLRNTGIVNQNVYITKGMFDWNQNELSSFYCAIINDVANNLKVKEGAKEGIDKLKVFGKIYIITGRDNGDYIDPINMTKKWLENNNIYYDKLIFTDSKNKKSKAEVCIKEGIDVFIEDTISITKELLNYKIDTLLMDTPYNKDFNEATRVYNFDDIYNYIKNKRLNVILDTDTYNECDDQFALTYLIKNKDLFNIEAITIAPFSHQDKVNAYKSIDLSYNEAVNICKELNFDTNKVYKGSTDYYKNGYNEENDAVKKIIDTARKNDTTHILAIGALTNIAIAIEKDKTIIDKIKIIWLGGHSIEYNNNDEYNFKQDIKAFQSIIRSGVDITIIPCKEVASILKMNVNVLRENINQDITLYKYLVDRFYNDGYHGNQEERVIWDISVIAYMVNRNWFSKKEEYIDIDNYGNYTPGNNKVVFVASIDKDSVYNDLFNKFRG